MAGTSKYTTDHETIRKWAEARGGKPVTVKGTEKGDEPGVLRIDFPGYAGGERFQSISWDEFFKKFDEKGLAMLYEDETSSGQESRFCKFVSRHTAEAKADERTQRHTHH
jgi:hypothetical protein